LDMFLEKDFYCSISMFRIFYVLSSLEWRILFTD